MKKALLTIFFLTMMIANQAMAVSLSLDVSDTSIMSGDPVFLDVNVAGLTAGGPDSVGAYDINVTYDSTIMLFNNFVFSNALGDISFFEAIAGVDTSTPGTVSFFEVSLLLPSALDAIQGDSFILATIEFGSVGAGTNVFDIGSSPAAIIADGFGNSLPIITSTGATVNVSNPIPEPNTMLLFSFGLIGFMGFKRRKN